MEKRFIKQFFQGCLLKKVDFEGAKMDKLTYNFLKGAKVDLSNVTIIN